jgi:hypothetical protein
MRIPRGLVLALVVMVGCDAEKGAPPATDQSAKATTQSAAPAGSTEPAASKLCPSAAALEKRIAPIDVEASRTLVDDAVNLPESKTGARAPNGSVIAFRKADITFNGRPVASPAEVTAQLEASSPAAILFAIDKADDKLARVAAFAEAIGDRAPIHVLASPPGASFVPPPPELAKELSGLDPSERAMHLAKALSTALVNCGPATKLFGRLATDPPDTRAATLKNELPPAVHACDCKVAAGLDGLVAYLLAGDRITVAKRLLVASDGKPISPSGLTGQTFYDALPTDGAPVRLAK